MPTRVTSTTDPVPSLVVERTIAAPVERVFAAWTDAALLARWLAPGFMRVVEAEADARPGGRYRIVVDDPAGTRHATVGEYHQVVPNERLVQSWTYEGPNFADPYPTLLTVEFRATSDGATALTIRQDQLLTPEVRDGNAAGWRSCLDKLEALLAGRPRD